MSAPEKEPETGTRDSHAKLQFREYQQERSESRKAAAAACRDSFWTGVRSPIPRWPRSHFQRLATYFTSRCCCCCCCCCGLAPLLAGLRSPHRVVVVVASDTSDKVPPAPVRAGQLPLPSCSRHYPRVRVCTCALTSASTAHAPHCFYVLKHTGHVFAR